MAYLRPGDTVSCKVKDGVILTSDNLSYDRVVEFEVISVDKEGFLIKVPYHVHIKTSFELTDRRGRENHVPPNFIGADAHFITSEHVHIVSARRDGEKCDRCQDFFPMAERGDNGVFHCYACRSNRWR